MALMTIPSLMVFLSLALPASANRWTNIVVPSLFVPASILNVIGEPGVFTSGPALMVQLALLRWYPLCLDVARD